MSTRIIHEKQDLKYLQWSQIRSSSGTAGSFLKATDDEYYGAAEPPVRCGESHLSGLTEPPHFVY